MDEKIKEPTGDQCNAEAKVYETEHLVGYAMWYPQMGGYVGKSVIVLDKKWTDGGHYQVGGCFEAYVWHNGEFPFSEEDGDPAQIHHCDPKQFVRFGNAIQALNEQGRTEKGENDVL